MTTAWYKDWFDTEYYHLLYEGRDNREAEDFLSRLIDFLEIRETAKIIDIGCGRGRHSIYLNKLGHDVTGIDLALHSIEKAQEFANERLHFYCHDNRKIFREKYFDVALNLFTSFGYLETREALLDQLIKMKENLKENGLFILDYFNSSTIANCHFERQQLVKKGITFNIDKQVIGHQVVKTIEVTKNDKKECFKEMVHLITEEEFKELFKDARLEILHIFGDYKLKEYDKDRSDRLIIIARKKP